MRDKVVGDLEPVPAIRKWHEVTEDEWRQIVSLCKNGNVVRINCMRGLVSVLEGKQVIRTVDFINGAKEIIR